MKCELCNAEHDTAGGAFLKHIKEAHGIISRDEYFYGFNPVDLCAYCNTKNRTTDNWKFERLMHCGSTKCAAEHKSKGSSERLIKRNLLSNPMKNPDIVSKMKESSKGKVLSEDHRYQISVGLSNYLSGLTDEEMRLRINKFVNITDSGEDSFCPDFSESEESFEDILDKALLSTLEIFEAGKSFNYEEAMRNLVD